MPFQLFRNRYFSDKALVNIAILLLCCIGTGVWALRLGADINWDLKNYHFYNPYALLNGKLIYDYSPAMLQSYNNPLLDLPIYWLIQHCKPIWVGFILGVVQGLNIFILYLLVKKLFAHYPMIYKDFLILAACVMGFYSAANLSEIGATFGDNIVSLFILFPFYLFVNHIVNNNQSASGIKPGILLLAGLLIGIGTGIKLTLAIYPIALAIAMIWIAKGFWDYIRMGFVLGIAVLSGFLLSIGYWMHILWKNFGNPLFPYFNKFFHSPYYHFSNFSDKRFLPDDLLQTIFYPFYFIKLQNHASEMPFRDIRLALCYVLFVFFIGYICYKKTGSQSSPKNNTPHFSLYLFIITFYIFSYFFWQTLFSIYRYVIVLEFLSPVFILIILDSISKKTRLVTVAFVFLSLSTIGRVIAMNWGRLPWADSYFGVEQPKVSGLEKSNIVILGSEPIAYIIPFFPKSTRFLRVEGNFTSLKDTTLFQKEAKQHLNQSTDNYILLNKTEEERLIRFEENSNLSVDSSACTYFKSRLDPDLCICKLNKTNAK